MATREPKEDVYLDVVDGYKNVHQGIVRALEEIYDEVVQVEDTEETRELLMHEKMLASA